MAAILMPVDKVISLPCVVFALRRESMYFRRAYLFQQLFQHAPCRATLRGEKSCQGPFPEKTVPGTFLMLETGAGAAAMETALHWCLSGPRLGGLTFRPRLLISAGFSGALQPELRHGDLVLATEVIDSYGNRWPAFRPTALAEHSIAVGRLLTMPELVSDPQMKGRLGRQYEALAVDMESAIVACLCQQHNVPFVGLRVISDDWQTALSPHLVELLRKERVSFAQLAVQLFRHPRLIGELRRLARRTRQAAWKLAGPLSAAISGG